MASEHTFDEADDLSDPRAAAAAYARAVQGLFGARTNEPPWAPGFQRAWDALAAVHSLVYRSGALDRPR